MKLTPAQKRTLANIKKWNDTHGPYNKEKSSGTTYASTQPVLEKLRDLGLIESKQPFAGFFHTVTLTEKGLEAVEQ